MAATWGAVFLGDLLRRIVLLFLGEPVGPSGPFLAAVSGLVAGSALALARGRGRAVSLALALGFALADRSLVVGLEALSVGPSFYVLAARPQLERLAVEAAGLVALLASLRVSPGKTRPLLALYGIFALSRLGPDWPDLTHAPPSDELEWPWKPLLFLIAYLSEHVLFVVQVLASWETYQLLKKWRPGR